MKIKVAIVVFIFLYKFSIAQKFYWYPVEKIKYNFQVHVIGSTAKNIYFLSSKLSIKHNFKEPEYKEYITWDKSDEIKLLKYTANDYVLTSQIPFHFNKPLSVFYDAFISNNAIYFFYASEEKNKLVLYGDKYDDEGQFKETVLLYDPGKEIFNLSDPYFSQYYTIKSSENKEFHCLYSVDGTVILFDKELKKLWTKTAIYNALSAISVLNDGNVFILAGDKTQQELLKYDRAGNSIQKKLTYSEPMVRNYNLKIDEKNRLVYIVSFYGIDGKIPFLDREGIKSIPFRYNNQFEMHKSSFRHVPNNDDGFFARGNLIDAFDVETLTNKNSIKVVYTDELLMEVLEKNKIEKTAGLRYLYLMDMFFTNNGGFVFTFQQECIVERTQRNANGSSITKFLDFYKNIVLITSDQKGNSVQKQLKRSEGSSTEYEQCESANSFFINNKLYILYNDVEGNIAIVTYVSNLDQVSKQAEEGYTKQKVSVSALSNMRLSEGKYLFWGREAKEFRICVVDFN